jgi:Flp pilus assembly protein protease CpaA
MTTSVTATVRGDIGSALVANPAGILVVVIAIALLVAYRTNRVTVPTALVPAGLLLMWTFELFRFNVF